MRPTSVAPILTTQTTWYGLSSRPGITLTTLADRCREHHSVATFVNAGGAETQPTPALKVTSHGSRVPITTQGIGQHTSEATPLTMFFVSDHAGSNEARFRRDGLMVPTLRHRWLRHLPPLVNPVDSVRNQMSALSGGLRGRFQPP